MLPIILMGIVGTILVFWSLSGFMLRIVQSNKKIYLKGTNMFVLRQINNKINTMVISMSVICLMLFMTISILSSSLSLRNTMQKDLKEMTPVDINLYKTANLPEKVSSNEKEIVYTKEQREDSRKPISETLINNGYDMNNLKDVVEIEMYATNEWTIKDSLGEYSGFIAMSTSHTNTGIILVPDSFELKEEWKEQHWNYFLNSKCSNFGFKTINRKF